MGVHLLRPLPDQTLVTPLPDQTLVTPLPDQTLVTDEHQPALGPDDGFCAATDEAGRIRARAIRRVFPVIAAARSSWAR